MAATLNFFVSCVCRYQTLAVATDANTKEDIGNKKVSGKKLTVIKNWVMARVFISVRLYAIIMIIIIIIVIIIIIILIFIMYIPICMEYV